jgi:hypothetical protein
MKQKQTYQTPKIEVFMLRSAHVISTSGPSANFMSNPGIGKAPGERSLNMEWEDWIAEE